jgi:hypothetical protein
MTEQITFVGPRQAAERMARARAVAGVPERASKVRAAMDESDRVHADSLAVIRKAADLSRWRSRPRWGFRKRW